VEREEEGKGGGGRGGLTVMYTCAPIPTDSLSLSLCVRACVRACVQEIFMNYSNECNNKLLLN
jgi:hypothetical protein